MRILLSGGGTAGHIYPALTVAESLVAGGHDVAFAGTPDGLEARVVPEAGIKFIAVKARGFDRARPLSFLTSGFLVAASAVRARRLIRHFRPDVVAGFGGYVSLPVGFAARWSGVPLVLHEQNSVPGLANRVLSRWAASVGVTYEGSVGFMAHPDRVTLTGNPVRTAVLAADRDRGRRLFDLPTESLVVLVFGGSRGARHINDTMVRIAPRLMRIPSLQVLHVAGRIEAASVAERMAAVLGTDEDRYAVVDYIEAMGDAIAAADIVVSRAGATSIAELTAIGRAAVLVPYPYATDDHQTLNAQAVERAGGALLVQDGQLDGDALLDAVQALAVDHARRDAMARASASLGRRDAAQRVTQMVLSALRT